MAYQREYCSRSYKALKEGKGMSKDVYADALSNSLTEIKNICPDVSCSFIFTKDGMVVAGDAQAVGTMMEKLARAFESVAENAALIGELDTLLIDAENGKAYISCANDMYLAMITSKNADITYLRSVTRVIIPTILKLLKSIIPTPLKFVSSQQLVVENITGFREMFTGDTVQIDHEVLKQWSELFDGKEVSEVEVEAVSGKLAQYKVKAINDSKLEGRGLIRMPEKTCQTLEVKKGELVRVKPIAPKISIPSWGVQEITL